MNACALFWTLAASMADSDCGAAVAGRNRKAQRATAMRTLSVVDSLLFRHVMLFLPVRTALFVAEHRPQFEDVLDDLLPNRIKIHSSAVDLGEIEKCLAGGHDFRSVAGGLGSAAELF